MPEEPTLGEVYRLLLAMREEQTNFSERVDRIVSEFAQTYVPRELWNNARSADQAMSANLHGDITRVETTLTKDIETLQNERRTDLGWRRQMLLALSIAAVGWLLTIVALVFSFVGRSS